MKKKSKKNLQQTNECGNNNADKKSRKVDPGSSAKPPSEGFSDKGKLMEKRKRKKSEPMESSQKTNTFGEEITTMIKKQKSLHICKDEGQYKPGMLSDFLQKQKYGHLILPWKSTFGMGKSDDSVSLDQDEIKKDKPRIKINPLFDTSKRNNVNTTLTESSTYTVFVGNLPPEITVNQVKKIFKKFSNTISKIKIRTEERQNQKLCTSSTKIDRVNDQSKHATVKFNSLDSYNTALNMTGKLYNGHHLRITGAKGETTSDPEKSIFVGNLAVGICDDDLWKTFEKCGEIDSVRVIRDKLNKKGTFGFVNFKSADSVAEALKLDGTLVLEREIRVNQINKNADSLSSLINVKRSKKKRRKPQSSTVDNGLEPKKVLVETGITVKTTKKRTTKLKTHTPEEEL
ncbi:uncharacterized protein LOC128986165 [Macrosteles quadrilineatus]|uniref:uncharacterized protein LOC128986165 n=1 Tax=Macrosteles quadrilineatus TaxID=74068 RepID=UPI0023E0CCDB|nr:uncharacterized protein LOC128986165 [Macrosteles quadrilineatus]XP_054262323.1 uncharacterized protein LOC128986165 [Macrosteles quadrilineatus]